MFDRNRKHSRIKAKTKKVNITTLVKTIEEGYLNKQTKREKGKPFFDLRIPKGKNQTDWGTKSGMGLLLHK